MKKRLRKKLHRGEFKEVGFEVCVRFDTSPEADEWDDVFDRLVEFVEALGLALGGGGTMSNWCVFVDRHGGGSATEEDRDALVDWLEREPSVLEFAVGELVDAYYGPWTLSLEG